MIQAGSSPAISTRPIWWDDVGLPAARHEPDLPTEVDLLVVGSGYTGLSAAVVAASGGMSTLVLDSEVIGFGCSTRNGGQVSTSIKPSLAPLSRRHGADLARRIYEEGKAALAYVAELAQQDGMDFDFRRSGRFHGAQGKRQFEQMKRQVEAAGQASLDEIELVDRNRQREEIGSGFYHGGMVMKTHAGVHPAKLHAGLLGRAEAAGAVVKGRCEVRAIERTADGFEADTAAGRVRTRKVLLATNGYTGKLSPWHRRRVIPIGSYILATEPLDPALVDELLPKDRMMSDTRRMVVYYRASPNRRRILFGGRSAIFDDDPLASLPRLKAMMCEIFPQMENVAVTHNWTGKVAFTFDTLPHIGAQDGLHYCMGYCGSGISLSTYFGMRAGYQILGKPEGVTALDGLVFPSRPYYGGTPWFIGGTIMAYRLLDRLGW